MPTFGTAPPSAYQQTCARCGETVTREAGWERLPRCPRCHAKFPKPLTFAPKSGQMTAKGGA